MILTAALTEISEELLIEILIRLPAKSLMRFKCVSKEWLSLISSRYLTNRFLKPLRRSRFLAYFMDRKNHSQYVLRTSSNHDQSDTSVSVIDQDLTIPTLEGGRLVSFVRGLLCVSNGRRVRICNLNTRQVAEWPLMEAKYYNSKSALYFGHDPVNDEYKVLRTVWEVSKEGERVRVVRSEHQVLILGAGASWKKTQCRITHRPFRCTSRGEGTINGVLYYRAWTDANRCVVMSFNLSSEEFRLIELPINACIIWKDFSTINLINYKGKVSVIESLRLLRDGIVDVWVLEDAGKSQWSDRKTLVLHDLQMNFVHGDRLWMSGTSRSGEVLLSKVSGTMFQPQYPHIFIYNLERNEITQRIEPRPFVNVFPTAVSWFLSVFSDDIENIMYLEASCFHQRYNITLTN